jgi:hypothetical protein
MDNPREQECCNCGCRGVVVGTSLIFDTGVSAVRSDKILTAVLCGPCTIEVRETLKDWAGKVCRGYSLKKWQGKEYENGLSTVVEETVGLGA